MLFLPQTRASCRAGGLHDVTRVLFCNSECHARFGSPRPQAEATELFNRLPEEEKQAARKWQFELYQVITRAPKFLLSVHVEASLVVLLCKDAPRSLVFAQVTITALFCLCH